MLNADIQATREQIKAQDAVQLLYTLVRLTPPEEFAISRLPLNICLVIDRSTSMKGERLDQVKRAASLVVDKLATDDVLSVVAYSDRAEVILPASRITNKALVVARLRGIIASGGTEIYQGLNAGVEEMRKASLTAHLNHLILLTDGHTYGDDEACISLVQSIATQNIGISAFGIGSEWNDHFLDNLVAPSGGQSGYIESPSGIVEYLQQRIHNLGAVYANNVRLDTGKFPPGVQLNYGLKIKPFAQPLSNERGKLHLGTVEGRMPLAFVLEFSTKPQEPDTILTIPFHLTADFPSESHTNRTFEFKLEIPVVRQVAVQTPLRVLVEAIRVMNLYRLNEKAMQDADNGHVELAVTRMQYLTTRLIAAGFTQLASQAKMETQRLEALGDLSGEGRKKLKFGTRALLTTANMFEL